MTSNGYTRSRCARKNNLGIIVFFAEQRAHHLIKSGNFFIRLATSVSVSGIP